MQRSNCIQFNFLPNDKILDWSKLKADNDINVIEKLKFGLGRVENIVRNQHFLLFPQCFWKAPFSASFEVVIVW